MLLKKKEILRLVGILMIGTGVFMLFLGAESVQTYHCPMELVTNNTTIGGCKGIAPDPLSMTMFLGGIILIFTGFIFIVLSTRL